MKYVSKKEEDYIHSKIQLHKTKTSPHARIKSVSFWV